MSRSKYFEIVIGLGSNQGDRLVMLRAAVEHLQAVGHEIQAMASIYETAPLGPADHAFLNSAVRCRIGIPVLQFLDQCMTIEKNLGRVRRVRWGNRTIDLDLLLCRGDDGHLVQVSQEKLTLPHPELWYRDFALIPTAEVAGDWWIPHHAATVQELLNKSRYWLKSIMPGSWMDSRSQS